MRDVRSKFQNLSALCLLLRTVILLNIFGVANVTKSEFTLRSWQRSSLDITLRVISDKSSKGRFVMWCASGMTLAGVVIDGYASGRGAVISKLVEKLWVDKALS
jgi:hypothetical protein